jgi:hypothetical protein
MGFVPANHKRVALVATAGALFAFAGCDLGEAPTTYAVPGEIAGTGDVNGDGHLDVVTRGDGQVFGVMVGDGTGGFTLTTVPHDVACVSDDYVSCSGLKVHSSDLNGDGLADVLVERVLDTNYPPPAENTSLRYMQVRLADPSGGFEPSVDVGNLPGSGTLEVVDVTHDGLPDLVQVDVFVASPRLRTRPGLPTGGFGAAVESIVPDDKIDEPSFADLNGDGDPDLVAGGACVDFSASGEGLVRACVEVALGDGSGVFTPRTRYVVADPAADRAVVEVDDVNEDGYRDVVVAAGISPDIDGGETVGTLSFFYGDGTGALGAEVTMPARTQTTRARLADFDADGHLDLLTATDDDHDFGRIRFGDGAGGFSDLHLLPNGDGVIADLDADGRPDYLHDTEAQVEVFMNRWDGRPS